ncbi:MAG: hypothetical protein R3C56_37905 [Pirellulaceae bacterium]
MLEVAQQLLSGSEDDFLEYSADDIQRMVNLAHTVSGYARHSDPRVGADDEICQDAFQNGPLSSSRLLVYVVPHRWHRRRRWGLSTVVVRGCMQRNPPTVLISRMSDLSQVVAQGTGDCALSSAKGPT